MLWPVLVVVLGFVLAFGPVVAGMPDLLPGLPEAIIAAGAIWSVVAWWRNRTRGRAIAAGVMALAAGLHLAWFFGISAYDEPEAAPRIGAQAPDIKGVRVRDGAAFHLAAQRGRYTLLVFFRGAW